MKRPFFILVSIFSIFSCKKPEIDNNMDRSPDIANKAWADSIFLYAQEVYLWNALLPSMEVFSPQRYLNSESNLNYTQELFDITKYAIEQKTNRAYEFNPFFPDKPKYSTIFSNLTSNEGPFASEKFSERFGFSMVRNEKNEYYIRYVIRGSIAAKSGIERGMKLIRLDGKIWDSNQKFLEYLSMTLAIKNNIEIVCEKKNITKQFNLSLDNRSYFEPILKDTILVTSSNKTIGYLAYLKFIDFSYPYKDIDLVLNEFENKGVSDIIIDLRYNTGGNLSELERLANLLIPTSIDNKIMRFEEYNNSMQIGQNKLLQNQPILDANGRPYYNNGKAITYADLDYSKKGNTYYFKKTRGLENQKKIYCIVSEETASAAELLISILKPYMQVTLIGASQRNSTTVKTFGKPIGFFPLKIGPYTVYYSLFYNTNANGEKDYFGGFQAELSTYDDLLTDLGSPSDPAIQLVLRHTENDPNQGLQKRAIRGSLTIKNRSYEKLGNDNESLGIVKDIFNNE